MTKCGIRAKPNTWSWCQDVDLCAPGDVEVLLSEDKAGRHRSIKMVMVRVRFDLVPSPNGTSCIFLKLTSTLNSWLSLPSSASFVRKPDDRSYDQH